LQISFLEYLRAKKVTIQAQPVKEEAWVSTAFVSYHLWEDERSNYAWDFGAIGGNYPLSYKWTANQNKNFYMFGKIVFLSMDGTVTLVDSKYSDNDPNVVFAVKIEDAESGAEVDLQELPHNGVEIDPSGPFLLRMLHLKEGTVPNNITEGNNRDDRIQYLFYNYEKPLYQIHPKFC
jgi:hypothetical protein